MVRAFFSGLSCSSGISSVLTLGDFLATTGVGLLGRALLVERLWTIGVEHVGVVFTV